ncbi:MAG: hypothetical protein QOD32_16 [Pyrinomonadaceae bacterium]|jgi:uncharacterized repeat protein (TIGR01451 family)|nr:hypothetical protein [Pyrinomonadaceae bacterium]
MMPPPANIGAGLSSPRRGGTQLAARFVLLPLLFFLGLGWQSAQAQLNITPTTWNIIGLDSNRVTDGPDTFQAGARVCNTSGATVNNVRAEFFWDSSNIYINMNGAPVIMWRFLAPGACVDFYYPIIVTRNSNAYFTKRSYHISVRGDGTSTVSTPTPRELYVEKLLSQGRNDVDSIVGPTTVYVGQTYNYTINAQTSTGYAQLESFLNLSNVTYQVLAVSATYSTPGASNDKFYADACGWQTNPSLANYRSCVGPENFSGGKVGGNVSTTYTVKILGVTGTALAGSLILDFSGGSFHYASGPTLTITALSPQVTLGKLANPASALVGTNVTYTLRLTNTGTAAYTLTDLVDAPPTAPATPVYVANSSTFNGVPIANPVQAGGTLTWTSTFTVPAGQSRDLTYRMTMPNAAGNYINSAVAHIDYTQIDTTPSPADNAPATATVNLYTPPQIGLCKTFPGQSCSPPPALPNQTPGSDITYVINFTNTGGSIAKGLTIADDVPLNTDFKVGTATAALGSTGLTVSITYLDTNGVVYTPVSGGGGAPSGYDRNVKTVRWALTGNLSQSTPNNSGSVSFTTRIR